MIALQSHILEFTQRLHTAEVERRGLLQEVSKLQEEVERLGPEKEELIEEAGDVAVTQQVGHGQVEIQMAKQSTSCTVSEDYFLSRKKQKTHPLKCILL